MTEEQYRSTKTEGRPGAHLTTRRAFLTGLGFSVVSLYGVWAAYGAAPTSLNFLSSGGGGGHGMGHGAGGGMDPEEFRRLTNQFVAANQLPDGSVKPRRNWMKTAGAGHGSEDSEHGHDEPHETAAQPSSEHDEPHGHDDRSEPSGHEEPHEKREEKHGHDEPHDAHEKTVAMDEHGADDHDDEPIDVYLMASRYGYTPAALRLDRGVRYRFRIMAVDANHGMSMNMRVGSHMMRCPARTLLEKSITFTEPGQLLVYCSVYCGEGHDMMWSQFIIA